MKKTFILLTFALSSFLFANVLEAQNTDPEKPSETKENVEHSDDYSELCKPDWSGYEVISPDISTRPLLYPTEQEKLNDTSEDVQPAAPCKKPENKSALPKAK